MSKKKQKTYKVDHPTIKEITIGDEFITYSGKILTFISYNKEGENDTIPFAFHTNKFGNEFLYWYSKHLKIEDYNSTLHDIKERYIGLKDKVNLL